MRKISLLIFILSLAVVLNFLLTDQAKGGLNDNVSGWAWSENIGWISMNCTNQSDFLAWRDSAPSPDELRGYGWSDNIGWISLNCKEGGSGYTDICVTSNYAIKIDEISGDVLGYAWSDSLGWLSFNRSETGVPPEPPYNGAETYIAKYNSVTRQFSGWGRFLNPDGWDGWIKLNNGWDGMYVTEDDKVAGWAWGSDAASWIAFQAGCAIDYGVDIATSTGNVSGYAWSERIGWISFNAADTAGCPIPPCEAVLSTSTLEISGWARALAPIGKSLEQTGGWDGWMKLKGNYGIGNYCAALNNITMEFEGWTWGGNETNGDAIKKAVFGWMSWNDKDYDGFPGLVDYQIITTASFTAANQPPTAIISCTSTCGCDVLGCGTPPDLCTGYTGCAFVLNNDSTDPNGEADISTSTWYLNGEEKYSCPGKCNITPGNYVGEGDHTSELKVADYAGETSNTTKSFTLLEDAEAGFVCSLDAIDWMDCRDIDPLLDEVVYVNDSQSDPLENSSPSTLRGGGFATIISREWMRESDSLILANATGTYFAFGSEYNQIRLTVIDDEGRSNYIIHTIAGKHSVPKWREIPPFI